MKKIFILMVVCLMAMVGLSSCGSTKVYKITTNYEICYPDGTKSIADTTWVSSKHFPFVEVYSRSGTNYISVFSDEVFNVYGDKIKNVNVIASTTAPIRLVGYQPLLMGKERKVYRNKIDGVYE